jgi:hypothetical protein
MPGELNKDDISDPTFCDANMQGLEILKASLQSKTVLTDVFLTKNRKY